MGCLNIPSLCFWKKWRRIPVDASAEKKKDDDDEPCAARPLHDSVISTTSTFGDVEKPRIVTGSSRPASAVPTSASIRTRAASKRSVQSKRSVRSESKRNSKQKDDGSDEVDDDDDNASEGSCDGETLRHRVKTKESEETWTGSLSSTQVSDLTDLVEVTTKEQLERDEATRIRQEKAEAARKKAHLERDAERDFFQFI